MKLLAADIRHVDVDGSGRKIPVGPRKVPIREYVETKIKSPEYEHFLRDDPARSQAAAPQTNQLDRDFATLGNFLTAKMLAEQPQRPTDVHPSLDLRGPFGTRPK